MGTDHGRGDPFRDVATWDEDTARQWVQLLDQRAAAPDQVRMRRALLRLGNVGGGDGVLEVGCGTGALLVDLARTVGLSRRVVGIDPQPYFVAAARERLLREHLSARAEVRVGSADGIDLPANSVQVCIAQTVLIHLGADALRRSLTEIRRVLTDRGRFVSVDQDADTWTIDHPDRELTRRIVRFNSDHRYADGWTGRRLHRMLLDMGFEDVGVQAAVHIDASAGSYLFGMAARVARAAAAAGVITQREAVAWEHQLHELAARGRFFSSMNYYLCAGRLH